MIKYFLLALLAATTLAAPIPLFENSDFEQGSLHNWTAKGDAMTQQPTKGDNIKARGRDSSKLQGEYFIGTYERYDGKSGEPGANRGDRPTGTLTSVPFTIALPYLNFLVGGGKHAETAVRLQIGKKTRTLASGADGETMRQVSVDVREFIGKQGTLIIADEHTGGWGHVNADSFTGSDKPLAAISSPAAPKKPSVGGITHAPEIVSTLVAQGPDVLNASAMDIDADGNIYIVETHRFHRGVDDNRNRRHWVAEDTALQTTAERVKMYEGWAEKHPMAGYNEFAERIIQLRDKDGDGSYETRSVFADGFNGTLDGIASGILTSKGRTYFACIPHIWLLTDSDDDGVADTREIMHEGFGVRVSISGHDLNGFVWGPDGKLYGSVGDRGYNTTTPEGVHYKDPVGGCAFRMNPDGSEFEVFFTRLRNPKALAFDKYGKLFTVDNDGNLGDQCTINYLIEGGEKGWHGGHQVLGNFRDTAKVSFRPLSPWTVEKQWSKDVAKVTAAFMPPIHTLGAGPSGMRLYPGAGLDPKYDNHFFLTNYRGSTRASGINVFSFEPDKGNYKMVTNDKFAWDFGATDCSFGWDGKLYACDFGTGWKTNGKGKLVSFHDPKHLEAANIAELIKAGFDHRPANELRTLLEHADMRVRLRAQFSLVKQPNSRSHFHSATGAGDVVTRLHGVWGLGQLARAGDDESAKHLLTLLGDQEPKVREQSAKALGTAKYAPAGDAITKLLADPDDHVKCLAAIAIGKLKHAPALDAVYALIEANADACPTIRHSAMMALLGISNADAILAHAQNASDAERSIAFICARRLRDARIASFLDDPTPFIRLDAIRAINDLNIESAVPAAAAYLDRVIDGAEPEPNDIGYQRLLNLNYRAGKRGNIERLLRFALSERRGKSRETAISLLALWNRDSSIDFSTGLHRPLPTRPIAVLKAVLIDQAAALNTSDATVKDDIIKLLDGYKIKTEPAQLLGLLNTPETAPEIRAQIFSSLLAQKHPKILAGLPSFCDDRNPEISLAALAALGDAKPILTKLHTAFDASYKQGLIRAMAGIQSPAIDSWLVVSTSALSVGRLDPAIALEVSEMAAARGAAVTLTDPMSVTLAGGDPDRGKAIFYTSGTALCQQCHFIGGGATSAGPNLAGIGKRANAEYILRSLTNPSADIAPGFGAMTLTLKDGTTASGFLLSEGDGQLTLKVGEATQTVALADITTRSKPISSMPPMGLVLKKQEVRDLVAFLSSLKEEQTGH
jgi:quinoprotein glucose dehydrogenase